MAGRETVHPADMQMVESSPILFVDNSTWNQNGMAQSTRLDPKLAWHETRVLVFQNNSLVTLEEIGEWGDALHSPW